MTSISPLAKLCAAGILGVVLLLSLDPVSAVVALVFELALLPWAGVPTRRLLRILTPLLIAAPFAGLATLLYGRAGGEVLVELGPGTGIFTEKMIKKLPADTHLVVIELNDVFYQNLTEKVKHERCHIVHGSANDLQKILLELEAGLF